MMQTPSFRSSSPTRGEMLTIFGAQRTCVDARLQTTEDVHPFMHRFLADVEISKQDFINFIQQINQRKEASILGLKGGERGSIPKMTHRIWLTNEANPEPPSDYYINCIVEHCLNVAPDYQNFFWSNSSVVISRVVEACRNCGAYLLACHVSDLDDDPLSSSIQRLIIATKFTLASDLMRFVVLRRFGGIYSDLGIKYNRKMLVLFSSCDYVLFLGGNLFFQTSLLAAAPESDLISLFYGILLQPSAVPLKWATDSENLTADQEVSLLAGPGFTSIAFTFLDPGRNSMVCSNDGIDLEWKSSASWYGSAPKYGNVLIGNTEPTLAVVADFDTASAQVGSLVTAFHCPSIAVRRAYILCLLTLYFERWPTSLCHAMHFNGSDKALGWHNYAYFYNYMLKQYILPGDGILEIGIGTNYLDTPSSMGSNGIPGASLRVWQRFFSSQAVFGADVDRRILFREPGIKTYFVDQTKPSTIHSMLKKLQNPVSLVLDDGLHTFTANHAVVEATLASDLGVKIIIVEDVAEHYLEEWKEFLDKCPVSSLLIRLPSEVNKRDNSLVMLLVGEKSHYELYKNC